MIFLLSLIKIEIKRVIRFLPHIVVGALALCFIIGIITFSASKVLYDKKTNSKVNIAISISKGDESAKLLISIIKDMKSIKENCNFIQVDNEEEAYEKVKEGEAYGAIIIPKHFVGDILDGTNTPATVVLPNKSSIESMLIKDLIDGGTKSLTSAQAGIYAISYEYEESNHERLTKALQDSINIKYMNHTLAREKYFNHDKVSATGELTAAEYYVCSGSILLLLLLGLSFSKYLSPNNKSFYERLKTYGIYNWMIVLTRIISVFIIYVIISIIIFLIYIGISKYLDRSIIDLFARDYFLILFVLFCISSFVVCVYSIMESQISGTLALFIITIIMNFISGGFIPTVFLPKVIQELSTYMPTYVLSKQIGNIILQKFDTKELLVTGVMLGGVYIFTAVISVFRHYQINNKSTC